MRTQSLKALKLPIWFGLHSPLSQCHDDDNADNHIHNMMTNFTITLIGIVIVLLLVFPVLLWSSQVTNTNTN